MIGGPFMARALADSRDRVVWAKARSNNIGASDAAGFAKLSSAPSYARNKISNNFIGNAYTVHGNEREPIMLAAYHLEQNFTLFRSESNPRHVATPDAMQFGADGSFFTVEAKTSNKSLQKIPVGYLRQMWWAQYVMNTDRTLFIWEEHKDWNPVSAEPESQWVYRDDEKINTLIQIADRVIEIMDEHAQFEMENS